MPGNTMFSYSLLTIFTKLYSGELHQTPNAGYSYHTTHHVYYFYYYCCQSFHAPHFVRIMYIKIITIFCAAWYVRPLQWFCRVKAAVSQGHSPAECWCSQEQGCSMVLGWPGVQWRCVHLTMDFWCSWGATASVDSAPLRVMREESEAVQTQPLF